MFRFWSGVLAVCLLTATAAADSVGSLGDVLQKQQNLTTFYDLIKNNTDLLLQLPSNDGVTICAPSNKAFENIPYTSLNGVWDPRNQEQTTHYLQYHILKSSIAINDLQTGPTYIQPTLLTASNVTNVTNGQNVLLDRQPGDVAVLTSSLGTRCTVLERDIAFQGGRIQVIDNLLIPPAPLRKTTEAFQAQSFLAALYAAGLMPDVDVRKNVTIFAPRDSAMDLVGGSLEKLNGTQLARIMGYHVVPNQILTSGDLANGTVLQTLSHGGATANGLLIRQAGNNKYVNSAQIVQSNILIANGIMHIISDVLNPDASEVQPNPASPTQPPVFPVAVASHPFSSALPCTTDCPTSTDTATTTATTTSTDTKASSKSSHNGVMPGPTAHVAVAALGVLGAGLLL